MDFKSCFARSDSITSLKLESPAPINLLPNEILYKVLSYLSASERINASLVCKKWLQTLNCRSLLKDIIVIINENDLISLFLSRSRKFINFKFECLIIDESYYKLFESFSSDIEYLCFDKCERKGKKPIVFNHLNFDKLKVLKSIDCDIWALESNLPNLKELYLLGEFADDDFSKLQNTMKNLQSLKLYCNVSCDRNYPEKMKREPNRYMLMLSMTAVSNFISERACTLKELHFLFEITPSALRDISSLKDLQLHKINLSNCFKCTDGLIDLFQNQPTLKIIILNGLNGINDEIINALCSLLPDAEEVSIHDNEITDKSLTKLFQLKKLRSLDIGGGQALSAQAFNEAILNFKAVHLRSLSLNQKLNEAENIAFDALFKQCKNLRFLNIGCNKIPDTVIHTISENLDQLEYLYLNNCDISDLGLAGSHPYHSLSNLRKLKVLDLSKCPKITENALISTIKFRYLEYLFLIGCSSLQPSTIQLLVLQNPCLEEIKMLKPKFYKMYSKLLKQMMKNNK